MAKPTINQQKILWIDMEMTGLDADRDLILELAAIVTDWQLNELGTIELVLQQDQVVLEQAIAANQFWLTQTETRDQLLAQNQQGLTRVEFVRRLEGFIQQQFEIEAPAADIVLGGNTIRADRAFIDQQLPEISRYLHYRMLDVSAWKVYFEAALGKIYPKPENHRALEDIRGSIAELNYFLQFVEAKRGQ